MKIITYSLKDGSNSSDNYYKCIGTFTGNVIDKAEKVINIPLKDFEAYIRIEGLQPVRSAQELIVEALTLGVLWKVYGSDVIGLNTIFRRILAAVSRARKKHSCSKHMLDKIKGILITAALSHPRNKMQRVTIPTPEQISGLLSWLEAFGDFEQEVKRLRQWAAFLSDRADQYNYTKYLMEFADWFEIEGQEHLGKYTGNVNSFLKNRKSCYRWREDRIFCFRSPVEYHVNMVGAQILSNVYRAEFINSAEKKVLLPICMRSRPEGECMAVSERMGLACAKCAPGCIVNAITSLGDKHGYGVYLISHESTAFSAKDTGGIVGVSCVTRLIEGGWKAKELGLPPQCVLLDYCGCKKHWDENGIPTTLNITELEKIMQESAGVAD